MIRELKTLRDNRTTWDYAVEISSPNYTDTELVRTPIQGIESVRLLAWTNGQDVPSARIYYSIKGDHLEAIAKELQIQTGAELIPYIIAVRKIVFNDAIKKKLETDPSLEETSIINTFVADNKELANRFNMAKEDVRLRSLGILSRILGHLSTITLITVLTIAAIKHNIHYASRISPTEASSSQFRLADLETTKKVNTKTNYMLANKVIIQITLKK